MKYVHSMWSQPSSKKNFDNDYDVKYLNINFYTYLFSTLLIKKLGYNIELFCDEKTYEIYSIIPYDKINVIDFNSDGVSDKFWIWGKIKTHLLMDEPYIHIDGDVLMFRDIIGKELKSPCVVQSVENIKTIGENFNVVYLNSLKPFNKFKTKHGIDWDKYGLVAYNCGVIGFNDMKLKNEYANKVKEILVDLSNDADFQNNRKKYSGMFLVAEQSLLYHLLSENKIKPLEIIPEDEIIKRNYNWMPIAKEIGYCHLWSYSKYKDNVINMIKYKIKHYFPEYQNIVEKYELELKNI